MCIRDSHKVAVRTQGAVHLIGGHLQVLLALFPSLGIGINRNDFVALIQLRPDLPADPVSYTHLDVYKRQE